MKDKDSNQQRLHLYKRVFFTYLSLQLYSQFLEETIVKAQPHHVLTWI